MAFLLRLIRLLASASSDPLANRWTLFFPSVSPALTTSIFHPLFMSSPIAWMMIVSETRKSFLEVSLSTTMSGLFLLLEVTIVEEEMLVRTPRGPLMALSARHAQCFPSFASLPLLCRSCIVIECKVKVFDLNFINDWEISFVIFEVIESVEAQDPLKALLLTIVWLRIQVIRSLALNRRPALEVIKIHKSIGTWMIMHWGSEYLSKALWHDTMARETRSGGDSHPRVFIHLKLNILSWYHLTLLWRSLRLRLLRVHLGTPRGHLALVPLFKFFFPHLLKLLPSFALSFFRGS